MRPTSALALLATLLLPLAPPALADNLRCGGAAAAPAHLALALGKSTLLRLPEPVQQRAVGNPAVLQALLVAPDTLYLLGADVGSTNLIVQGKGGSCSVVEVVVSMDASALRAELAAQFPNEQGIRVSAAADALVLSGVVTDGPTLAQVLELAQAFVRQPARPVPAASPAGAPAVAAPVPAAAAPGQGLGQGAAPRLVNLLAVSAPQQVMLEVQVAEVAKTLLDRMEAGLSLKRSHGNWTSTLLADFLTGTLRGSVGLAKGANWLALDAEKENGQVRILAEPTVIAISGQEGSFLAGGKVLVPVAQDNNRVTLEEKEFGVGLRFTPTVLAGGRIHLKVAPEVSELSRDGVGVTSGGFGGHSVLPLITTRRASTTVQLQDGQSFAIGGLIRNNQVANARGLPLLAEIPVLGALFRSTDFQNDRSELLFVITARLVRPLAQPPQLPGGLRSEGATP